MVAILNVDNVDNGYRYLELISVDFVNFGRFCQSWLILLIFGLSILKMALRGLARALWALPWTSMVTDSQILTLAQWDNTEIYL